VYKSLNINGSKFSGNSWQDTFWINHFPLSGGYTIYQPSTYPAFITDLNADAILDVFALASHVYVSSLEAGLLSGPLAGLNCGYSVTSSGGDIFYRSGQFTRLLYDLNNDNLPDYLGIDSINNVNVGILNTPNQNPTISAGPVSAEPWKRPSLYQYALNYTFLHKVWANIPQTTINRVQALGDANGDGYPDLIVFDCNGVYVYLNGYVDRKFVVVEPGNNINGNQWNSEINFCDQDRSNAQKLVVDVDGDGLGKLF
jgi:hypothetical protein